PSVHTATEHESALPAEAESIAEVLKQYEYHTYACITNFHLGTWNNFNQGFDVYDQSIIEPKIYKDAYMIGDRYFLSVNRFKRVFNYRNTVVLAHKRVFPWLDKYHKTTFFMYCHYMDPHRPYDPPPPYNKLFPYDRKKSFEKDQARYDGEIRFFDDNVKKLFDRLKKLRIYDKSLIIITADHGEAFGEHGLNGHGNSIYENQIRVPLIIKLPHSAVTNALINHPVGTIDIKPTILDILGIQTTDCSGRSLLPLIHGHKDSDRADELYIELDRKLQPEHLQKFRGLIVQGVWKYIHTVDMNQNDNVADIELFNLRNDPEELHNNYVPGSKRAVGMKQRLDRYRTYCSKTLPKKNVELDQEKIKALKALGYIQ
ncbi:MAG: sulfatase-like hydrolase/transferase, partial [Elusimicrobia bacterium]|nr:sulfatase-like hydrolase/transferase [Elusimicrobiota bacterium]MBD3412365.1 sulfatase-like hydrolase/transferase [Elusimicrobiota bacterium]